MLQFLVNTPQLVLYILPLVCTQVISPYGYRYWIERGLVLLGNLNNDRTRLLIEFQSIPFGEIPVALRLNQELHGEVLYCLTDQVIEYALISNALISNYWQRLPPNQAVALYLEPSHN